jgi:hypothetical protein
MKWFTYFKMQIRFIPNTGDDIYMAIAMFPIFNQAGTESEKCSTRIFALFFTGN